MKALLHLKDKTVDIYNDSDELIKANCYIEDTQCDPPFVKTIVIFSEIISDTQVDSGYILYTPDDPTKNAHAEGLFSIAFGDNSHAEGNSYAYGENSHARKESHMLLVIIHTLKEGQQHRELDHIQKVKILWQLVIALTLKVKVQKLRDIVHTLKVVEQLHQVIIHTLRVSVQILI